jgi:uncharacterized protein
MISLFKNIISENQERDYPKSILRDVDVPENTNLIISLIGARRSGKTYLLYQTINKLIESGVSKKEILFINFEDERLDVSKEKLDDILKAYQILHPDILWENVHFFFDEIQNIEGWEKFVRRIFDTLSKNIFITGSNAKLLSTEIATELRGRALTIKIFPLSLNEFLRFHQVNNDLKLSKNRNAVIHHTERFMLMGGFPEITHLDQFYHKKVLQDYFNVMIFRDIIDRYKVTNTDALKFFVKKIFASVTKGFSINKTYNDLRSQGYKISNNYLYDYFDYCNAIFLCQSIKRFDYSEIKQLKSEPKSYIIDTGLLSAIEFSVSQNKGKLFENMVFLELLKSGKEVFYFKNNYECDFVINEEQFIPIQASYSILEEETRLRELRGLKEACEYLNVDKGVVLTFNEEESIVFGNITIEVMPMYKYFLAKK